MPDLQPVFDELPAANVVARGSVSSFRNPSDANSAAARKVDAPAPDTSYLLLGAGNEKYPDGLAFAGVQIGKRYVSYHLMCVYLSPDLLAEMSPQLQERMHGKSCFNFTRVRRPRLARDAAAVSALSALGREAAVRT